jgi:amino acid adenylation domain-containing protein/FkbH-like protein/FkbM family methyltransferase
VLAAGSSGVVGVAVWLDGPLQLPDLQTAFHSALDTRCAGHWRAPALRDGLVRDVARACSPAWLVVDTTHLPRHRQRSLCDALEDHLVALAQTSPEGAPVVVVELGPTTFGLFWAHHAVSSPTPRTQDLLTAIQRLVPDDHPFPADGSPLPRPLPCSSTVHRRRTSASLPAITRSHLVELAGHATDFVPTLLSTAAAVVRVHSDDDTWVYWDHANTTPEHPLGRGHELPDAARLDFKGTLRERHPIGDWPVDSAHTTIGVVVVPAHTRRLGATRARIGLPRHPCMRMPEILLAVLDDGKQLTLVVDTDPSVEGRWHASSVARSLARVLASWHADPGRMIGEVVVALRPLAVPLTISATFAAAPLEPVLRHWYRRLEFRGDIQVLPPRSVLGRAHQLARTGPSGSVEGLLIRFEDWLPREHTASSAGSTMETSRSGDTIRLPNGLLLDSVRRADTVEMYREIYIDGVYFDHGVSLPPKAVVVDVGANIGMFSLFVHTCCASAEVHAVEPMPALRERLVRNLERHGVSATVHPCALTDRPGVAQATYYPHSSQQSGLHADLERDLAVARRYAVAAATRTPGSPELQGAKLNDLMRQRLDGEPLEVTTCRLSDLINEHGLARIDLLKVDVEGAEASVLAGIDDAHWPLVDQLVIEVHDVRGRLAHIVELLGRHGYRYVVSQHGLFLGTPLFLVHARRSDDRSGAVPDDGELSEVVDELSSALDLAAAHRRQILLGVCPPSAAARARRATIQAIDSARRRLEERVSRMPGVHWLDIAAEARHLDTTPIYRANLHETADVPFSEQFYAALGTSVARRLAAGALAAKKVIAVDADDTLWEGTCGEVGPHGVGIGGPYRALQAELAERRRRGTLLCLVSKNEPADVEAVFAAHRDMPLKLTDFAAVRVGWLPKSEQLLRAASDLDLDTSAFVFVDNAPAERQEVRTRCPEVVVLDLPDDPARFADAVRRCWPLDKNTETPEDLARAAFYQANPARASARRKAMSHRDYLVRLQLDIDIDIASIDELPRVVQLAHRTTQFNLEPSNVAQSWWRARASSGSLWRVRLTDTFGDYGLVGAIALDRSEGVWRIEAFTLSCRALGRNVEWAVLLHIAALARDHGVPGIHWRGRVTDRNTPVRAFFEHVARLGGVASADGAHGQVEVARLRDLHWLDVDPVEQPPSQDHGVTQTSTRRDPRPAPGPARAEEVAVAVRENSKHRHVSTPYVPPRTAAEAALCALFEQLLRMSHVGVHDDLHALGADSITATHFVAACAERLGWSLEIDDVRLHPSVAELASLVRGRDQPTPSDVAVHPTSELLVSPGQARLWAAETMAPPSNDQTIPRLYLVHGSLDPDLLEAGLRAVVERHHALRTLVRLEGGKLVPILDDTPVTVYVVSLLALAGADVQCALDDVLADEARYPMRLDAGPLVRLTAVQLRDTEYVLSLRIHHAACDGWSVSLIETELGRVCGRLSEGRPPYAHARRPRQFSDYIAWLRGTARAAEAEERARTTASAWTRHRDAAGLPNRSSRPSVPRRAAQTTTFLGRPVVDAIHRLACRSNSSPFIVYLTALHIALRCWSGRWVTVGVPMANRRVSAHHDIVGFMVNFVPHLLEMPAEAPMKRVLEAVGAELERARQAEEVPYSDVLRALGASRIGGENPFFHCLFSLHDERSTPLRLPDAEVSHLPMAHPPLPLDLIVDIIDLPNGAEVRVRYDAAAFHAPGPESLSDHLVRVLHAWPAVPWTRADTLCQAPSSPSLPSTVPSTSLAWTSSITRHVLDLGLRIPQAPAVRDLRGTLTYGALRRRVLCAASTLRKMALPRHIPVAILAENTAEWVVAALAVWASGHFYASIDASTPEARCRDLLGSCGATLVLVDRAALSSRAGDLAATSTIGDLSHAMESTADGLSGDVDDVHHEEHTTAYVLFTSGSTGRPKGVVVGKDALANYIRWASDAYGHARPSTTIAHTSVGVDMTLTSIFVPLVTGGTVIMSPPRDPEALAALLRRHELDFLKLTPTALAMQYRLVGAERLVRACRQLVLGGEPLFAEVLHPIVQLDPTVVVHNEYGPTESTVACCAYRFEAGQGGTGRVPIGTPLPGIDLEVRDGRRRRIDGPGTGELYILGHGLAEGYLHASDEAMRAFDRDETTGRRHYRTGDHVRRRADGVLVFLNRVDDEVKVRGHRVEPEEPRAALLAHPQVASAAVVAARRDGHVFLAAYAVCHQDAEAPSITALRAWLTARLPAPSVPARVEILGSLPTDPGGKVDRAWLRRRATRGAGGAGGAKPVAATGRLAEMTELWRDILERSAIAPEDHFFAVGGDSILALGLVSRCRERGWDVTIRDLFDHPILRDFATRARRAAPPEDMGDLVGPVTLSAAQHAFLSLEPATPHHWNLSWTADLHLPFHPIALRESFADVVRHHAALRSRFTPSPDGWHAEVLGRDDVPAPFDVVTVGADEAGNGIADLHRALQATLHLTDGPITRLVAVERQDSAPIRLLWITHHFVVDLVSWRILSEDLLRAYRARLRGEIARLPRPTASIRACMPPEARTSARRHTSLPAVIESETHRTTRLLRAVLPSPPSRTGRGSHGRLLWAIAHAWCAVAGLDEVCVAVESPGRTGEGTHDLSRVVGWFTTLRWLTVRHRPIPDTLEEVHDALLSAPTRPLAPPKDPGKTLLVNNLGDLRALEPRDDGLAVHWDFGCGNHADDTPLLFPVEILCRLHGPRDLQLTVTCPADLGAPRVVGFLDELEQHLGAQVPTDVHVGDPTLSAADLAAILAEMRDA